jgi:hypothetical protein
MTNAKRDELEQRIESIEGEFLPAKVRTFIKKLYRDNSKEGVGFRRRNMPALLLRFFVDMSLVFDNLYEVTKTGAEVMMVLGNNSTSVDGEMREIPSVQFCSLVGQASGFEKVELIPITVTKEAVVHSRNSITDNTVIRLKKS